MDRVAVLNLLATAPRRIASVAGRLSESELNWKPAPDSWSVNEVLAHLRCCGDVWGGSIRKILHEDQPTFRYVSPRGWIRKTNYLELDFKASFSAFVTQREDLLKTLRALPAQDWTRRGNVRAGAKVREETILSYAQRLADHESAHCDQIDRVLRALLRNR